MSARVLLALIFQLSSSAQLALAQPGRPEADCQNGAAEVAELLRRHSLVGEEEQQEKGL